MSNYHTSVLLKEAIEYLEVEPGKLYIDATLGGGGHSGEIIKRGGLVLGIDTDQEAIDYVREKFRIQNSEFRIGDKLILARGNFRNIGEIARKNGFGQIDGILFDLGVSSHQFDTGERGFSFLADAPLDMRMDKDLQVTAKTLLAVLSKHELAKLFFEYGEERFANRIADQIVSYRKTKHIETTSELADLIKKSVPNAAFGIHPATRVFQALRIAVNDELNSLQEALSESLQLLGVGGRIVIITFHSLEDRIVKHAFLDWEKAEKGTVITKKPIIPTETEIKNNTRSRSAKMRVFEKIKE